MNENKVNLMSTLPAEVETMVNGVNIFVEEVEPERSVDPMIHDKAIKLSKSELAFLRKGSRFMFR